MINDYICIMYIHQKDCSFLLNESAQNIVQVPIDIFKHCLNLKIQWKFINTIIQPNKSVKMYFIIYKRA